VKKQYNNRPQKTLPKIDLSFKFESKDGKEIMKINDTELFGKTAESWAEAINRTKKTQARNFYDKVLELEKEIKEKDFESVYPFIKMLNSKVAYAVNRRVVSQEFQDMMNQCLSQISADKKGKQTFKNFKLFFEAVLGYFKGSN